MVGGVPRVWRGVVGGVRCSYELLKFSVNF